MTINMSKAAQYDQLLRLFKINICQLEPPRVLDGDTWFNKGPQRTEIEKFITHKSWKKYTA